MLRASAVSRRSCDIEFCGDFYLFAKRAETVPKEGRIPIRMDLVADRKLIVRLECQQTIAAPHAHHCETVPEP